MAYVLGTQPLFLTNGSKQYIGERSQFGYINKVKKRARPIMADSDSVLEVILVLR